MNPAILSPRLAAYRGSAGGPTPVTQGGQTR